MSPNRREVLAGLGGATIAYALQVGCTSEQDRAAQVIPSDPEPTDAFSNRGRPNQPGIDAREWLIISEDGIATAYTSRTEIGQGLTTVLHDLVGQSLELPRDRVRVVLGDTDLCPADGPTTGSAATQYIAWTFWMACHEIKADLVLLASESMGVAAAELEYRAGEVVVAGDPSRRIGIGALADGQVRRVRVEPSNDPAPAPAYVDRGTGNFNAEAIVTGTLRYTGDYHPEGCVYGALLSPAYHATETRLLRADIAAARRVPGVVRVLRIGQRVAALGETYTAVQRAMRAMDSSWSEPDRPRELDVEAEIRAGAELNRVMEQKGNVNTALAASTVLINETYVTQFMTQVPMETDTAVASVENGRLQVRLGTQNPFFVRRKIADQEGVPESQVRVIAAPAGGAFGSKADNLVGEEAAFMLRLTAAPVKYVYSRTDDICRRARFKEAVVFDVTTGFDDYGRLLGRKIDIFQDEGYGTQETYDIPNVRTQLYQTRLPIRHGTMRGTSFVQSVFALESHTDTVARRTGHDPLDFRRAHVELEAFLPLIDHCAEAFDYGNYSPPEDHGLGFAICNHGGRQLGVVGAEVRVDANSGEVSVVRLAGAFDIGVVINHTLATNGIKGAMIWGIGAALLEEVELDGHRCLTSGFGDYRIPRMSDTPPIEVAYFDNQSPGVPRGCGEAPVPPTAAAIANAVYNATGIRFYQLPITPERVLAALAG
jgi:CO/xanthine dehydrogenase Mo-binding subunit